MDAAEVYTQSRARMIELAERTPADCFEEKVPATPDWTARDLFSHAVGVAADVAAGQVEGAGTNEWTARQVEERKDKSVAELVDEWRATAEAFDPMVKQAPPGLAGALASDVLHHELDLRGALGPDASGVSGEQLDGAVDFGVNLMAGFLDRRIKKAELPGLRVRAANQEWTLGSASDSGSGEPAATLTTTPIEFFRVLAGRRSEAQVRAMDWDGDPTPYLPVLSAFGPLAATDVTEPFS
jgi:uncharacterized protein (TIGR03083 family)